MPAWTDREIWHGLRDPARADAAFRALHRQHAPRMLGLLRRMCRGDGDRAEDLLNQALYKAYSGLTRMEIPCRSLTAWLYTVAARTALDEFAREADPAGDALPLDEELLPAAAAPGEGGDPAARAIERAVEAV